jgi:sucrose-6-phosphate hydrolase SacC (GH32 family)
MKNIIQKLGLIAIIISISSNLYGQVDKEQYNPSYHFYPSGDPTGLFYKDGMYYNNWGTASSSDFVHWNLTESGLLRRKASDPSLSQKVRDSIRNSSRLGGSGTIVVDEKNTSGLGINGNPPLISFWHNDSEPWANQVIGLAYSNDNAKTWTRYEKYPILDINSREFRDPKVFWHEPTKKWILAIGWADVPKIKFFGSSNLIDWEFLSDFGPYGAVEGVWECVELFPLAVDNDPNNIKWVLSISVQPLSGQYFIGDFDGTKFTIDPEFAMDLKKDDYKPLGEIIFDFERGLDDWTMEGTAFIESPSSQALFYQGAVMGKEGLFFANSHHDRGRSTGKITSPVFKITKDHINFLAGGNHIPNDLSVNLLVDEKIVRSQTGNNSGGLQWMGWDVSEFKEKNAKIEIVDKASNGAILADHFMLCDDLALIAEREKAFWVDYGPDFFAVRAWNNYAENEDRTVWIGWMGSWRYGGTEPVRGIQSIPRKVELKAFSEGVRLVQTPIKELQGLRGKHLTATGENFEGIWKPKKFKPSKNTYELIVDLENISADDFGLKIGVGQGQQTIIGYNNEKEELYVDRRDSGLDDFISLFPQINEGPLKNRNNNLKLHVFVDNCSVEVFANDGETVISSKIYPDVSSLEIELFSNHGKVKVKALDLWELKDIELK